MKNLSARQIINWLEEEIYRLRAKLRNVSGGIQEEVDPEFTSSPVYNITTGATVLVRNRVDVVVLLPTWNNVSGASVDILITEK